MKILEGFSNPFKDYCENRRLSFILYFPCCSLNFLNAEINRYSRCIQTLEGI